MHKSVLKLKLYLDNKTQLIYDENKIYKILVPINEIVNEIDLVVYIYIVFRTVLNIELMTIDKCI